MDLETYAILNKKIKEIGMGKTFADKVITIPVIDSILTLKTDKLQTATVEDNTTIVLPTVDKYTEIHLFFDTTEEITITLPLIKWQNEINIEANKTYEFIFTYTDKWLGGCLSYVKEVVDE